MFRTIKLGGKITVFLTLIWAICLCLYLNHGLLSASCEVVVGVMTLPLAIIEDIHYVFLRRGVIGLGELFTSLAMMIPNLFILGYGLAFLLRTLERITASFHLNRIPTKKSNEPNKNR